MKLKQVGRRCLGCGAILDRIGSRQPDDVVEAPADETAISVCWLCGYVQVFTADGFRELSDQEIVDFAGDADLVFAGTIRGPLHRLTEHGVATSEAVALAEALLRARKLRVRAPPG